MQAVEDTVYQCNKILQLLLTGNNTGSVWSIGVSTVSSRGKCSTGSGIDPERQLVGR